MAVAATIQFGLEFPAIDAQITAYADASATILVPANAAIGSTELVVTVNNRASNALSFEVLP